jgi:simple sugar transport system ATP-binding protein
MRRRRKELGIAHVPEDRHRRGLLLDFSLAENTILGVHYRKPAVSRDGILLDQKGIQRRTEQVNPRLRCASAQSRPTGTSAVRR